MNYTQYRYLTMDQSTTEEAVLTLRKASVLRIEGKPEQWARDVERKALRKFEHSFCLRHMFDRAFADRPSVLPPSSYSNR